MKKVLLFLLPLVVCLAQTGAAQSDKAVIRGQVLDENGEGIPNASVALYDTTRTNLITGISSDSTGGFLLRINPGKYVLNISFLSFRPHAEPLKLEPGEVLNLGEISLTPTTEEMGEIVVEGERSHMEMSFDKRVFQVGTDITSLGGTALDVLDKVPSLSTDIDGNISLRGNEAVRVLINGKPSNMVQDDVESLRSLPANRIKEVEIITNPSARYSAEGSAGIINIILKKKRDRGFNGSIGTGGGIPEEYEFSTNLNYRMNAVNFFLGGGIDYRSSPESGSSFQRFSSPDTSYMYREITDATESELEGSIRFGADIFLSENQTLTGSASVDLESESNIEDVTYTDMELDGDILQRVTRNADETEEEDDVEFRLEYENKIDGDEHKLTADADFDLRKEREQSDLSERVLQGSTDPLLQRTDNREDSRDFRINADYVRPIGKKIKLETGMRTTFEHIDNSFLVEERQNGIWTPLPAFNDNFIYSENVNAAYLMAGKEWGPFSAKIGLRTEHTRIRTELKRTGEVNRQNYIDLFPSVFLNYGFNKQQSVQLSYSRRLSRPWSRMLLPFSDFSDSRSRFTGNPDLQPEYSNSFEAGYLHYWGSGSLLTSFYYRHRTGVIERITTLDNQGITRIFPINLATEESWGVEFSADQKIANALTITANANLFQSNSEGTFENQVLTSEAEMLQGRMELRWNIAEGWKYQASMRYRGPRETTQGRRAAMTMIDTGISRKLFDGKATLAFNVRDLLNSRNFQATVNDPNFFSERRFSWSTRTFSLNLTYHFNRENERRRERRNGRPGLDGGFEEEF